MASERQLLQSSDPWWGEHIHRYNCVLPYIEKHDRVLDIACGTGFGSDILSEATSGTVIGGDISEDAVKECRKNWKRSNLTFEVLDGTQLPYTSNSFDKIISFETIEHTTKYNEMTAEFGRVLKPGGQLFLSTPNSNITSPVGVISNPFHTQEFNYMELRALLSKGFGVVEILGQRYCRYDNKSGKQKKGRFFEKVFLSIGIRKMPYTWRSGFMKLFFGYPLYPLPDDFKLEIEPELIKKKCPVLFARCTK
jgi:ubiquinone/menaquinone biosynthesis C-methylase UbiE